MQSERSASPHPAAFRTHDPRLEHIAAKVMDGERLGFNDGLVLYGSPDVLERGGAAFADWFAEDGVALGLSLIHI